MSRHEPFAALSDDDLRQLRDAWVAKEFPNLPYDQRTLIAHVATQHPEMDHWDIQAEIILDGGPEIPEALIQAFLASVR